MSSSNSSKIGRKEASAAQSQPWLKMFWQEMVLSLLTRSARWLQSLSRPAAMRFAQGLGGVACLVAVRQRRRSCANLHLAYGDSMTPTERHSLTRRVFKHFACCLVDFLRAPMLKPQDLSNLVVCEGWEYIEAAQGQGKGVVLVTGHIGNWEILGRWLALVKEISLTVVAKDPRNPALAAYLRRMREGAGFAVLSQGVSARSLLQVLKRSEVICLLADQNSGDLFVPFFGLPTGTVVGPASLALHSDSALIPIYCLCQPDGSFLVRCLPQLSVPEGCDRKEGVAALTAAVNQALEEVVRQYPEQWLWLHNRWKSAFARDFYERAWGSEQAAHSVSATPPAVPYETARERWQGR